MSDSPSSPPTSTVTPPTNLRPPPRPPRLRPPSRDSNASGANTNSGAWTDVTFGVYLDQDKIPTTAPTLQDCMRDSFIDNMNMNTDPVEAASPTRDLSSPIHGSGDTLSPPANNTDAAKRSSEQTTKSVYSVSSDAGSPSAHPSKNRSTVKSVFLVLSCAGAMIINVCGLSCFEECPRVVLTCPGLDCECHGRLYRPSNHRRRLGD